ncbi:MAG: hypothetical protein H0U28_00660 [Nocardioidaceae bacterium]|nr:hypothetical protein [Nocardioidaceae bacterium]
MNEVLYGLAVLACPVGMGAMMWIMMRGRHQDDDATTGHGSELAQLHAEVERLREVQRDDTAISPPDRVSETPRRR